MIVQRSLRSTVAGGTFSDAFFEVSHYFYFLNLQQKSSPKEQQISQFEYLKYVNERKRNLPGSADSQTAIIYLYFSVSNASK